jgi:hypothetical protein
MRNATRSIPNHREVRWFSGHAVCLKRVILAAGVSPREPRPRSHGGCKKISQMLEQIAKKEMSRERLEEFVLAKIDPKLRPMFQEHLRSVFKEIAAAHETQTVTFADPLKFKAYYLSVLQAFPPNATLIASSIPRASIFGMATSSRECKASCQGAEKGEYASKGFFTFQRPSGRITAH